MRELISPSLYKPLLVGIFLMVFQQFSGINIYITYLSDIFKNAGVKDANLTSIYFQIANLLATAVAVLIVDRTGRKILLIISGIGMCLCNIFMGLYYYIVQVSTSTDHANHVTSSPMPQTSVFHSVPLSKIYWVTPASATVFIILFAVGWGPLPWLLMSEIFPPRPRGSASSIVTVVNWLGMFLVTETFPAMKSDFTEQGTFWFYAGCCLLGFLFTYFFVPETKGKTLEEIEALFDRNRGSTRQLGRL